MIYALIAGSIIIANTVFLVIMHRRILASTEKKTHTLHENFYPVLFQEMSIPVILCNPDGSILSINNKCSIILKEKKKNLPGINILDFIYKEDREAVASSLYKLASADTLSNIEQNRWLIRRDGSTFLARIDMTLLKNIGGQPILLCELTDISRSMMQDKQIREYTLSLESRLTSRNRELSDKNKLLAIKNRELMKINKSRNIFFTNVSHELRTPLVAVCGYVEMLLEGRLGKTSDQMKRAFTVANSNLQRLTTFINRLLDLARLESYKDSYNYQKVDLKKVTQDILYQFQEMAAENNVGLYDDIPDNLPDIIIDPQHIEQILYNLISNAIKFTHNGDVRIYAVELMRGRIELQIRDTGCGIPEKDLPHIFDRFYQVARKNTKKEMGSGLGLAIVKEIVNHYSGKISIKENIKGGTVFSVELYSPENEPLPQSRSGKILVVSSNQNQNAQIRSFFSPRGYRVEIAKNGLQALEIVENSNYDLIITDLMLPDLEGIEICSLLKDRSSNILVPVYITTYHLNEDERNRLYLSGVKGILTKPFQEKALERILRKELQPGS